MANVDDDNIRGNVVIVNIKRHTSTVPRSPGERRPYHHGDLRSALLEAAVEVIEERGLSGLSLRECARRAGVSHAAPYRHFKDKDALILAIAHEGLDRLADAGEAAMVGIEDPRERIDAYGVAYVQFAVEQPVFHRVMFASDLGAAPGDLPEPPDRAFRLLVDTAAAAAGEGADPELAAVAHWSLAHGLSIDRFVAQTIVRLMTPLGLPIANRFACPFKNFNRAHHALAIIGMDALTCL